MYENRPIIIGNYIIKGYDCMDLTYIYGIW